MPRIVCISDTHCQLDKIAVPMGDILVHAGDLTYRGTVQEVSAELEKMKKLRHPLKILSFGNHDWLGERNYTLAKEMCEAAGVLLLNHEAATVAGIKFFGSAYTPEFHNWAFNVPRDRLEPFWDDIPEDTQVLITHGPPRGILDKCPNGDLAGCDGLLARTQALPALTHHVFGHIHEGYGMTKLGNVTYVNASSCTGQYKPTNAPIIFDI